MALARALFGTHQQIAAVFGISPKAVWQWQEWLPVDRALTLDLLSRGRLPAARFNPRAAGLAQQRQRLREILKSQGFA